MKEQVCQGVKCEGTGLSVGEVGFNNKFQMASGQGSHWLIESPTIFSSMCSPPL